MNMTFHHLITDWSTLRHTIQPEYEIAKNKSSEFNYLSINVMGFRNCLVPTNLSMGWVGTLEDLSYQTNINFHFHQPTHLEFHVS